MWRRACPVLIIVLGVALVFTRRSLHRLEADELERALAEAGRATQGMAQPVAAELNTSGGSRMVPGWSGSTGLRGRY